MPKRLKGIDQTNSDPLVFLEVGIRANNLPSHHPWVKRKKNKNIVTEIRSIDNETNVTAGAVMMLLREGQQESQRQIGPIAAPQQQKTVRYWNMRVEELGSSQSSGTSQKIVPHKETTHPDDSRAEHSIISLAVTEKTKRYFSYAYF